LKLIRTKILFIILFALLFLGCNTTKRVPDGKKLLVNNYIKVDNKKEKSEEVTNQLYQKQNSSLLGYKLRLNLYNLAKQNTDSLYLEKFKKNPAKYYRLSKWLSKKQVKRLGKSFWYSGFHNFLIKTGEAPIILDTTSTKKSTRRLNSYFFNKGYFNVSSKYKIDSIAEKKVKINYTVTKGNPFIIDSVATVISSKDLDSIYQLKKKNSFIKVGEQFDTDKFEEERGRITEEFRNNGAFKFQQNYINFDIDTINKKNRPKITIYIDNEAVRINDSTHIRPFKLYKISKVNIFTDHSTANPNAKITDSATYKNFNLYSVDKLKYKPKAIANGVFINKDNYFSDYNTSITSRYLTNLKVFNYPLIQYIEDKNNENKLIANIYLTPRKKYTFGFSTDFTHSNIQEFGISGSTFMTIRNIFNGAETFDLGFRGNIGSSRDLANPNNTFFNISEIGVDAKLNFPRLFLPFNTDKIIPKKMIPFSTFSVGYAKQRNVGLDKQNFTNSLTYSWTPKKNVNFKFDLLNIQFVKNLNPSNYFIIYESSYNALNAIAQNYPINPNYFNSNGNLIIDAGTTNFINDALNDVNLNLTAQDSRSVQSIAERRKRLTENNLIFASNITFSKTSKKDFLDDHFYAYKIKFESAGNVLSLMARASKELQNQSGTNTFFDVEYSQYAKSEFEYIRHWSLSSKQVFAAKAFFGIAIPYGNSKSIPFSRSYFGGGSNDIRAWQSYSLGPGASASILDFNEANMKITLSSEYRFNIFGKLNGALFIDAGNIWNVLDNVTDEKSIFDSLQSLENIAIGSGFGLRYDFNFFVVRTDFGFKTYNPSRPENEKWFKEMRFDKSVLNIGINYPF
jgi:hypothetical protein